MKRLTDKVGERDNYMYVLNIYYYVFYGGRNSWLGRSFFCWRELRSDDEMGEESLRQRERETSLEKQHFSSSRSPQSRGCAVYVFQTLIE